MDGYESKFGFWQGSLWNSALPICTITIDDGFTHEDTLHSLRTRAGSPITCHAIVTHPHCRGSLSLLWKISRVSGAGVLALSPVTCTLTVLALNGLLFACVVHLSRPSGLFSILSHLIILSISEYFSDNVRRFSNMFPSWNKTTRWTTS